MPRGGNRSNLDLTNFRSYIATRSHYTAEAIALRLLLTTAPPEITNAPDVLAWMLREGHPADLRAHVRRARTVYAIAQRAAAARAARAETAPEAPPVAMEPRRAVRI